MFNFNLQRLQFLRQFFKRLLLRHSASLLLLGAMLPFYTFGKLAEEVWEHDGGFSWDVPLLLAVHRTAQPQMDAMAIFLTKLGEFWGVFPLALAIALFLLAKRYWQQLAYFLTVLVGSIVINRAVKLLLHRVRPHLWQSPAPELDYGFPSGHAMSSMTLVEDSDLYNAESRFQAIVRASTGGRKLSYP